MHGMRVPAMHLASSTTVGDARASSLNAVAKKRESPSWPSPCPVTARAPPKRRAYCVDPLNGAHGMTTKQDGGRKGHGCLPLSHGRTSPSISISGLHLGWGQSYHSVCSSKLPDRPTANQWSNGPKCSRLKMASDQNSKVSTSAIGIHRCLFKSSCSLKIQCLARTSKRFFSALSHAFCAHVLSSPA